MFRWIGRREGPGGVRRIEVPGEARSLSTLARVDYADAFVADVDVHSASAASWGETALSAAPPGSRATLIAGWSALGLQLGRGPDTMLGWRVQEDTPDLLLLDARSRVRPGFSAQLLLRRRDDDLLFCTFVMFHSAAARLLWRAVEPIHVRVVPELLEDARVRAAATAPR